MILVVDNNLGDHQLIRLALEEARIDVPIHVAIDGKEGQRMLLDSVASGLRYRMALVDLNMPRLDGRGLLSWARSQDCFRDLPMVVLTSSHAPMDHRDCMAMGATAFIIKPPDFFGYQPIIASLAPYLG